MPTRRPLALWLPLILLFACLESHCEEGRRFTLGIKNQRVVTGDVLTLAWWYPSDRGVDSLSLNSNGCGPNPLQIPRVSIVSSPYTLTGFQLAAGPCTILATESWEQDKRTGQVATATFPVATPPTQTTPSPTQMPSDPAAPPNSPSPSKTLESSLPTSASINSTTKSASSPTHHSHSEPSSTPLANISLPTLPVLPSETTLGLTGSNHSPPQPASPTSGLLPTPPSSSDPPATNAKNLHKGPAVGAIVGGVIAGIVTIVIFIIVYRICQRRRRQQAALNWMREKNNMVFSPTETHEWSTRVDSAMAEAARQTERVRSRSQSRARPDNPDPDNQHTQDHFDADNLDKGYLNNAAAPISTGVVNFPGRGSFDSATTYHSNEYNGINNSNIEEDRTLTSNEGPWEHTDGSESNMSSVIDVNQMNEEEKDQRREELLEKMRRILHGDERPIPIVL